MNRLPSLLALTALLVAPIARADEPAPKAPAASEAPAAPAQPPAPVVSVPTYENRTCPIMAKASSTALFTDTTEHGRIYVCCLPCVPKIQRDQERAYTAAYPNPKKLENTVDPWTGETLGTDAVTVSLQGYVVRVAPANVKRAQANAQIVLVKALRPKTVDIGNLTSPISNKPVVDNVFVLVDDDLIRLAAPAEVEQVKLDPEKARKTAKETAARQTQPGSGTTSPSPGR
jgi:hypothetical protein